MKRTVININEDKCTGCGLCIPNCPEGAIQMIDGKARLVSDLMCDGLGACLGHCPEGAITTEEREAEPYDEYKVMENIVKAGANTIQAHLKHLTEHGQDHYLAKAKQYLRDHNIALPDNAKEDTMNAGAFAGCPGAKTMAFAREDTAAADVVGKRPSALAHWPIQMHLMSPLAPHYRNADMLLAADCVAFSLGDFHKDYLDGKALAIACPKLDEGQEVYVDKLKVLIDEAKINTLTVMIMLVPCCGGLLRLAKHAAGQCERKVPIKAIVVSLQGKILSEEWV
ncbi:MAG: 4Fe-4S dicluster domain-containing protein [Chitinivibrionales bacterium]|nr:4Fe-4S dicluster domain-containing protein [Chitinivibrionales bacterium]MBD3396484.1 4Fe-4S dicluster domain-containing protein [Chitinivibrionales bacterium]